MSTCGHDSSGHLLDSEWSGKIIGAAIQVINELEPGLDKMSDENALMIEPTELGLSVVELKPFPVHYRSGFTGRLTPDLIHGSGT